MYTEENERGRFPLRDILLKLIIVIVFIALVIFILSKVLGPNNNTKKDNTNYNKTFNENIEVMKKAAISYYTKDRLPIEDGKENTLTLREMINLNLLEAFVDSSNKSCDVNKSYIKITKNADSYTLKVNLKCQAKEDYTLTKLGVYSYCEHYICEEKEDREDNTPKQEEVKEVEITKKADDNNQRNTQNNNSTNKNYRNSTNINSGGTNNVETPPPVTNDNATTPTKKVMYEYKKEVPATLSSFSKWSSWAKNSNRYEAIMCNINDATCLKEIQLTSRVEQVGYAAGKPMYATVNYYSYRTRRIIKNAYTDIKWSTYNDNNLLNSGYTYTGNKK